MLKTLIRPAMIFVPFLLGILFPQAHVLNDGPVYFIRWALIAMVFLSCLQIRLSELRPQREHWVILGLNLLMGIVPYGVLRAVLPDAPEYALAAFFVGITPTATAAPVVVAFLNGRIGFALTGFTITNVFISLAMLGLLPAVTGNFSIGFAAGVAKTLLLVVALPFGAAHCLRRLDFAGALYRQFLFRASLFRPSLLPRIQPAAGAEEYDFHHVSGIAVCGGVCGNGADFLHSVA